MLGGSTIKVVHVNNDMNSSKVGTMDIAHGRVNIVNKYENEECSMDYKEATFFHELTHAILFTMGENELSENERFIEGFANLLHQYVKTVKYGK